MDANPVRILLALIMVAGLIIALLLGNLVASSNFQIIAIIFGLPIGAMICMAMGKKIWFLIPACWLLNGKISILPLPFSVQQLGIIVPFGAYLLLSAFKKLDKRAPSGFLDLLMWINLAYLVSVYLRNPVGVQAMGSEMVGGKPYFDVLVTVCGYWVIQHVTLTPKEGRVVPLLMSIGSIVVGGLGVLTQKFPFLVPVIAPFYNGISVEGYLAELRGESVEGTEAEYRIGPFQSLSINVGSMLSSYYRPFGLFLFFNPVASIFMYLSILAGLMAGFRSGMVNLGVTILLSSYFFAGLKDVIRMIFCMIFGVAFLMAVQSSGVDLPYSIQRALSFIPGPWDPNIVHAAQASTDWRTDMWEIALHSDKYIHNKWLGDGFGFSAYELAIQMSAAFGGTGYLNVGQTEAQLVTGAFHSGPISAIRFVGVVGLTIFTIFLIACSHFSWKLIWRAKGTPFFATAIFIGTAAIIKPFFFLFIFGGFDGDLPNSVFTLAMLNLVSRSIEYWRSSQLTSQPISQEPTASPSPFGHPEAPELPRPFHSAA